MDQSWGPGGQREKLEPERRFASYEKPSAPGGFFFNEGLVMRKLAFLHTAQVNSDLFKKKVAGEAVIDTHLVREDLLLRATKVGEITPELNEETQGVLRGLANDADVVLLTCSTLGPAADAVGSRNILRVDRALAERAVKDGGTVAVLVAVETTIEPTRDLFEAEAAKTGARINMVMVKGAWPLFQAGDMDGYLAEIAGYAKGTKADVIALAQASMAPAVELVPGLVILNSPEAGLAAALRRLG
jgi:hypothetical protein